MAHAGFRCLDNCNFAGKILAAAVAAALLPGLFLAGVAEASEEKEWTTNVELFAAGRDDRVLGGAEALLPFHQSANAMTFADVRGWIGDEGTSQLSLGLGHRFLQGSDKNIFGFYGFLDSKETETGERFNQASAGFEVLSMAWEFRTNYHYSLTDRKLVGVGEGGGFFQDNDLFAASVTEEALDGYDAEVGLRLPLGDQVETRLFFGGYHLDGEAVGQEDGWRTRIEFRPRTNVAVELAYQKDDIFDDRTMLTLRYSFGYRGKSGVRTVRERMIQPPVSNADMYTTDELPAAARESTAPEDRALVSSGVYHIHNDPSNDDSRSWASLDDRYTGTGTLGTYENPYTSVAECYASGLCQDAEYIYVHAGDGTTGGYQTSFLLEPDQHLIGQGVVLYGFGGDAYPNVTAAGHVVVLADDTEVAGLAINGSSGESGNGIFGQENTGTIYIHDNLIGLMVDNSTGLTEGYGVGQQGIAIYLEPNNGESMSQELILERNVIQYNGNQGVWVHSSAANGSEVVHDILLLDNDISHNADMGIEFDNYAMDDSTATQTINGERNTIRDNGWNGFDADNVADNNSVASQEITLVEFTVEDNYHNGIEIWQGAWPDGTASQTFTLQDSCVSGNGAAGADVSNNANGGDATQVFELTGNEILDNQESGVRLGNEAPPDWVSTVGGSIADQSGELTGNLITGNGNDGVFLHNTADQSAPSEADTAVQAITLTDNTVEENGDEGIEADNHASWGNTAAQTIVVSGGSYSNNNSDGIDLEQYPNDQGGVATQTLTVTGAVVSGNGSDGFEISSSATNGAVATQAVIVSDTEVSGNTEGAANVENEQDATGVAVQTVDFTGSSFSGNGIDDVLIVYGGTQTIILPDGTVITFP